MIFYFYKLQILKKQQKEKIKTSRKYQRENLSSIYLFFAFYSKEGESILFVYLCKKYILTYNKFNIQQLIINEL